MITCHGYNNPVCNAHKAVGVQNTWKNMVFILRVRMHPLAIQLAAVDKKQLCSSLEEI